MMTPVLSVCVEPPAATRSAPFRSCQVCCCSFCWSCPLRACGDEWRQRCACASLCLALPLQFFTLDLKGLLVGLLLLVLQSPMELHTHDTLEQLVRSSTGSLTRRWLTSDCLNSPLAIVIQPCTREKQQTMPPDLCSYGRLCPGGGVAVLHLAYAAF